MDGQEGWSKKQKPGVISRICRRRPDVRNVDPLVRVKTMTHSAMGNDEWKTINWKKIQRDVYRLQTRIYRAKHRGDTKQVHRLQKLMLKSRAAKLLSLRRVTQDNVGKKTAGVDGIKSLNPSQRLTLANTLRLIGKAKPPKRVMLPKPGTEEKRPLGIPWMVDRARQGLVKLALEPRIGSSSGTPYLRLPNGKRSSRCDWSNIQWHPRRALRG